MRRLRLKIILIFLLPATLAAPAYCQQRHIKYTKQQRRAAGFWRVDPPQNGAVQWLAIYLGDSAETMIVRWPTGLGCQDEAAQIQGNRISIRDHFPAVIDLHGSDAAELAYEQMKLHLRKTRESTNFVCE